PRPDRSGPRVPRPSAGAARSHGAAPPPPPSACPPVATASDEPVERDGLVPTADVDRTEPLGLRHLALPERAPDGLRGQHRRAALLVHPLDPRREVHHVAGHLVLPV